jgi:hypothetical protein
LTLEQLCLAKVSAKQTIPTGKIEAKVTFMLCINHRMMDTVHIRRDDNPSSRSVDRSGEANVAVVEHGDSV